MILRNLNEELKNNHKSPFIYSEQGNIVSIYLTDMDRFEDLNDKDMSYLENNATIIIFLAELIEGDFMGKSALLGRRHEQGIYQRTAIIKT